MGWRSLSRRGLLARPWHRLGGFSHSCTPQVSIVLSRGMAIISRHGYSLARCFHADHRESWRRDHSEAADRPGDRARGRPTADQKLKAELSPQTLVNIRKVLRERDCSSAKVGLVTRNVAALVDPPRVPRPSAHFDLRHSTATLLLAQGVHLRAIWSCLDTVLCRRRRTRTIM